MAAGVAGSVDFTGAVGDSEVLGADFGSSDSAAESAFVSVFNASSGVMLALACFLLFSYINLTFYSTFFSSFLIF